MVLRQSFAASRLRLRCLVACAALLLSACGGGGEPGRHLSPGEQPLRGSWVVEVTEDSVISAPVEVAPGDVPGEDDVDQFSPAEMAALVGMTLFPPGRYDVTVTGRTVRVVNLTDTNYTLVIDTVRTAGFQGCGACGPGSTVRFEATLTFTESGTLNGVPQSGTGTTLGVTYRRTA